MSWEIRQGDCVEKMRKMDEASVDAIVTDPPYLLGFMSKPWDMQLDHKRWATEALRVLKPGGHLLAFGGTRTYHRLACAIEDAGFEIRDSLIWLYGSGFPKSLDVSKAIDRQRNDGAENSRLCGFLHEARLESGLSMAEVEAHFERPHMGCAHWFQANRPQVPTLPQWVALKELLGFGDKMDAEAWGLNGRKGRPGENWEKREKVGEASGAQAESTGRYGGWGNDGDGDGVSAYDLTVPATPEAQRWQGWGTALKPGHEPIVVARKPLSGTVAANVLEHGTGALNVDGCRVEGEKPVMRRTETVVAANAMSGESTGATSTGEVTNEGRWPANVILDEQAAAELDAQSGRVGSNSVGKAEGHYDKNIWGGGQHFAPFDYGDTGGASRFFYTAKASRSERNAGLGGFEAKPAGVHDDDAYVWPENGDGTERNKKVEPRPNHHPTVKPINLMRWLCRLVTPPDGLILDPFLGSGTTGIAAILEDFDFIGIEREAEYVEIAKARIQHHANQPVQLGLDVE